MTDEARQTEEDETVSKRGEGRKGVAVYDSIELVKK